MGNTQHHENIEEGVTNSVPGVGKGLSEGPLGRFRTISRSWSGGAEGESTVGRGHSTSSQYSHMTSRMQLQECSRSVIYGGKYWLDQI